MAYLDQTQLLSAAQKAWPEVQWRSYQGSVVGVNPQTGVPVRAESDRFGRVFNVKVGSPFVESQLVERPVAPVPRWMYLINPTAAATRQLVRSGNKERFINDQPFTYSDGQFGGHVTPQDQPKRSGEQGKGNRAWTPEERRRKRGGNVPRLPGGGGWKWNGPNWGKGPFDALSDVGKGLEDTFNKVLITGGIIAGAVLITFVVVNRK